MNAQTNTIKVIQTITQIGLNDWVQTLEQAQIFDSHILQTARSMQTQGKSFLSFISYLDCRNRTTLSEYIDSLIE